MLTVFYHFLPFPQRHNKYQQSSPSLPRLSVILITNYISFQWRSRVNWAARGIQKLACWLASAVRVYIALFRQACGGDSKKTGKPLFLNWSFPFLPDLSSMGPPWKCGFIIVHRFLEPSKNQWTCAECLCRLKSIHVIGQRHLKQP